MWQRIQTVWLALATLMMLCFAFQDMAVFTLPSGGANVLGAWSIRELSSGQSLHSSWPIGVGAIISAIISAMAILLYRSRMLQMRVVILNIFIQLGILIYIGVVSWYFCRANDAGFAVKVWLALPIISMILQYIASRRIMFDELLVRTSNRLR